MPSPNFHHISVLKHEAITCLNITPGDTVIDCTAGGGGHTELLLEAVGSKGKVLAFDRDSDAILHLQQKFTSQLASGNLLIFHKNFSKIEEICQYHKLTGKISAILADIGVSSFQLSHSPRGFSFLHDGPLDMRMNQNQPLNATKLLENASMAELITILRKFGEEKKAVQIAKAICKFRSEKPINSTKTLAEIVSSLYKHQKVGNKHPATKTFQAIRIAVNEEISELEKLLASAIQILSPKGRLGIISFHSLEDRVVKQTLREWDYPKEDLRGLPVQTHKSIAKIVKPFPITVSDSEIDFNIRSRSAKLRVCEKL